MQPASEIEDESPDLNPNDGLPDGWQAVESESHPGEVVYENIYTGERIAWKPTMPASDEEGMSPDITGEAEAGGGGGGGGGLPDGWLAVESQSRPGELVYENGKLSPLQRTFFYAFHCCVHAGFSFCPARLYVFVQSTRARE